MARLFTGVVIYSFFVFLIMTPLKAKPSDKSKTKQNKYGIALIIGNKNYKDGVPPVDYAHNDAAAFKRYVIDILKFRERNIIYLRDATKANLDSALGTHNNVEGEVQSFVREGKSDVIIYYSGHGVPGVKSKRGLLLPTDATSNNAELVGYPIDQLYKNLSKIGAKSVTVFLEACFSGGSEGGMLIKNASPVFTRIEAPKSNLGITILSATSKAQLASWDNNAKHGMFTNYLLQGLYGAADQGEEGNKDGKVSLLEIKEWLNEEMTYNVKRQHKRRQIATVIGEENLILASVSPGRQFKPIQAFEKKKTVARAQRGAYQTPTISPSARASLNIHESYKSYGILPIKLKGKRCVPCENILIASLEGLPDAKILRGANARKADVVVSSFLSRLNVTQEANDAYASAKVMSGMFGAVLGKNIVDHIDRSTPPSFNIFDVELMLTAKDKNLGVSETARGIYFDRKDARQPKQSNTVKGINSVFRQAAERLAVRLMGGTPPPIKSAAQIRKQWEDKDQNAQNGNWSEDNND
ncbi:MAG: hypothetical protein CMM28_10985 [Rhodospirillaceae bacterium]|nr:hypothetical protein [Rhodospirillaceae bacterium]